MRRLLFRLLTYLGIPRIARRSHKHRLVIVLYHGVAPQREEGIYNYREKFLLPEAFARQIAFLARHYTVLELDDACRRLRADTLPDYPLVITFDDGYRNLYDYAFSVLQKYKLPATVYLPTDFVLRERALWVDRLEFALGTGTGPESLSERRTLDARLREAMKHLPDAEREQQLLKVERECGVTLNLADAPSYAPLTHEMMHEMQRTGIRFGAHTVRHPILTKLSLTEAAHEIEQSKQEVAEWCDDVSTVFSYPNGQADDFNTAVEQLVENAGFVAAVTTLAGTNDQQTPRYELRRITLDGTDDWATFLVTLSGIRSMLQRIKHLI